MESYKRVNKATARKMYRQGCDILLLPCKVNETAIQGESPWIEPITISFIKCSISFDRVVNEYECWNCNAELGYYAHYYVSEEDLDKYKMCQLMCM